MAKLIDRGDRETSVRKILEAARSEFTSNGLAATKIENIARAAGVSPQLVFHYYGSKEDLYKEVLTYISVSSVKFIDAVDIDSMHPTAAIAYIVRGIVEENVTKGGEIVADQIVNHGIQMTEKNLSRPYQIKLIKIIQSVLERGRQESIFKGGLDAEKLLVTMVTMSMGYATSKSISGRFLFEIDEMKVAQSEWTEFAVQFILDAMRP